MDGIVVLYIKQFIERKNLNCRRELAVLLCSWFVCSHLIMASEMALLRKTSDHILNWLHGLVQYEFWQLVARQVNQAHPPQSWV